MHLKQYKLLRWSLGLMTAGIITGTHFACTDKESTTEPAEVVLKPTSEIDELSVELVTPAKTGEPQIREGQTIELEYTAWLYDHTKPRGKGHLVDGSQRSGGTFRFDLGDEKILPAWNDGLKGARVGETRRLIVPAELAYGEAGAGQLIPPNAPLVYEIKILRSYSGNLQEPEPPTQPAAP